MPYLYSRLSFPPIIYMLDDCKLEKVKRINIFNKVTCFITKCMVYLERLVTVGLSFAYY